MSQDKHHNFQKTRSILNGMISTNVLMHLIFFLICNMKSCLMHLMEAIMKKFQEEKRFRMIFFSSAEVYGDCKGIMSEDVMDNVAIKQ
jgi:hypothetical protein